MRTPFLMTLTLGLLVPAIVRADDAKDMQGVWVPTKGEIDGVPLPEKLLQSTKLTIGNGKYAVEVGAEKDAGTLKLDSTKNPRQLDITSTEGVNKGKTFYAIYELSDDTLTVCYGLESKPRPTEFKTRKDGNMALMVYKRMK